jgi:hypothetical protein
MLRCQLKYGTCGSKSDYGPFVVHRQMLIDSIVITLGAKNDKVHIIGYLMRANGVNVCFATNNFWKNTSLPSYLVER